MAIGLVNNNADAISRRMFLGWVFWNGGGNWQRIFDLGAGQGRYLFLTPRSSSGGVRFAITTNNGVGEQTMDGTAGVLTAAQIAAL